MNVPYKSSLFQIFSHQGSSQEKNEDSMESRKWEKGEQAEKK